MNTYTITKSQFPTDAGYIYNFEKFPQDNLYIKICNLFLPDDKKAIKRGKEILQDKTANIVVETFKR